METSPVITSTGSPRHARTIAIVVVCALLFGVALAVRLMFRSDRADAFDAIMPSQTYISHRRAVRMLSGHGILLWDDADPSLLRQIRRPPGYAVFLATIYLVTGPDLRRAQVVQIAIDAVVAVALALLVYWLVGVRAAVLAGLVYALSPHLAVYSTIVTPDCVAAWPVFVGGVCFIASLRMSGWRAFTLAVAAGIAIGASCWLTAQGLTLPLVLMAIGVAVAPTNERRHAVALGALLVVATLIVVAPLTIRNVAVYGALVPVRPGLGVTLVEGLGVYDPAFPATDGAVLADEAARFGRPEYGEALYKPDGLEREKDRTTRALASIASRPLWFVSVMLDRMRLMLTYDAEGEPGWPRDTAYVGVVERGGVFRWIVRTAERIVFHTWLVMLLVAGGGLALVWSGRWRTLALLGAIPLHHCILQSFLLTEYKYTLPIHVWLFAIAGCAVSWRRARASGATEPATVS